MPMKYSLASSIVTMVMKLCQEFDFSLTGITLKLSDSTEHAVVN